MSAERKRRIIGQSQGIKALYNLIDRVAATRTSVLIIGESGTGKELVAREIHDGGAMSGKPFVAINCGAIPEHLLESELFGHKRGSFTGAVSDKAGLFESAKDGTLFLDEVGELPLNMQVKLLRALQDRQVRRVGANENIPIHARIIAATNRDLEKGIADGTFREDLYYRLNVIQLKPPPLRDRGGDIKILAEHFLRKYADKAGKSVRGFAPEVMELLEGYQWPGNVRELENVLERAVTLESGESVSLSVLPAALQGFLAASERRNAGSSSSGAPQASGEASASNPLLVLERPDFSKGGIELDKILNEVEHAYLQSALAHSGGVKKKAAELLGITFRSIRYRLKKFGVDDGEE